MFFALDTFPTIVGIGNPRIATHDASSGQTPVVAFVTYMNYRIGIDKAAASDTQAVTFFTQTANGNAWLFAALFETRVR